jgi:hypothetical protein
MIRFAIGLIVLRWDALLLSSTPKECSMRAYCARLYC